MSGKTIAIDFDGVIHKYSKGWHDGTIYDEPMKSAFESIKKLMDNGYSVFILSTRNPKQIKKWLDKYLWFWDSFAPRMFDNADIDKNFIYGFKSEVIKRRTLFWEKDHVLGITNRKLPAMIYLDDRAMRFVDWNKAVEDINRDGLVGGFKAKHVDVESRGDVNSLEFEKDSYE